MPYITTPLVRRARSMTGYALGRRSQAFLGSTGWRKISAGKLRGLRGLGQDDSALIDSGVLDPYAGLDPSLLYAPPTGPSYSGNMPVVSSGPAPTSYTNAATVATPPPGCALCYATPQAAIAAGVNPQTVSQDWGLFVRSYSSPGAAVAAGVPAGAVTQFWSATPGATAISPTTLLLIGGGLLALVALSGNGGGRGRR